MPKRAPGKATGWSLRGWPDDLAREAVALLKTAKPSSELLSCASGTEPGWIRPRPPAPPKPGTVVVSSRDGTVEVVKHWPALYPEDDTEAAAYPLAALFAALSVAGVQTQTAREIATICGVRHGQYVMVSEEATVGAALRAWGRLRCERIPERIAWGDRMLEQK